MDRAAELADEHRPDVIVLDAECDHTATREATVRLARAASTYDTPLIVLGNARRPHLQLAGGQFVAKPYHYGPLIRRIEELLAAG